MKVDSKFIVEVRGADGAALPEVKAGEATFVIAKPGTPFTVHVKRLEADSFTECVKVSEQRPAPAQCSHHAPATAHNRRLQVLLKVDGKCPGQAKRLRLGQEATFMGWLQEGGSPCRPPGTGAALALLHGLQLQLDHPMC
jgi:hypothetical protein